MRFASFVAHSLHYWWFPIEGSRDCNLSVFPVILLSFPFNKTRCSVQKRYRGTNTFGTFGVGNILHLSLQSIFLITSGFQDMTYCDILLYVSAGSVEHQLVLLDNDLWVSVTPTWWWVNLAVMRAKLLKRNTGWLFHSTVIKVHCVGWLFYLALLLKLCIFKWQNISCVYT